MLGQYCNIFLQGYIQFPITFNPADGTGGPSIGPGGSLQQEAVGLPKKKPAWLLNISTSPGDAGRCAETGCFQIYILPEMFSSQLILEGVQKLWMLRFVVVPGDVGRCAEAVGACGRPH